MKIRLLALLFVSFTIAATSQQASAQIFGNGISPQQVAALQLLIRQASRFEQPFAATASCHPHHETYGSYGESSYGSTYADQMVQNELVEARVFWEKRRLRQEYLEQERQRHMMTEQDVARLREHQESLRQVMAINYEIAADRARRQAPGRTDVREVNPVSGDIHWPATLRDGRFAAARIRLEEIFSARASYEEAAWDSTSEIPRLTRSMTDQLQSMVRDMPSSEYVAAKTFLKKLEYESRFAPASAGLAAR